MFKTKRDSKGNIERYKAHLIAKGFTQQEGIDYKETPIFMKDSFRIIMVLMTHFDMELHQIDVKTVFLNGNNEGKNLYGATIKFEAKVYNIWFAIGFHIDLKQTRYCELWLQNFMV